MQCRVLTGKGHKLRMKEKRYMTKKIGAIEELMKKRTLKEEWRCIMKRAMRKAIQISSIW